MMVEMDDDDGYDTFRIRSWKALWEFPSRVSRDVTSPEARPAEIKNEPGWRPRRIQKMKGVFAPTHPKRADLTDARRSVLPQ